MWFDEMKTFYEDKIIEGRNLGKAKASFGDLHASWPKEFEARAEVLQNFQKSMIYMMEHSKDVEVNPMKIKDDRVVVDWYWVEHTKAWNIPNTDDLKPYIPKKMKIVKWLGTIVGFAIIALIIAFVMSSIV